MKEGAIQKKELDVKRLPVISFAVAASSSGVPVG
jgi:hypothetical protein